MRLDYSLPIHLWLPQLRIFYDRHRHKVVVAGARFGKTTLGLAYLIFSATNFPRSKNWYICPTRVMAKDIAWARLKFMLRYGVGDEDGAPVVRKVDESELLITLINDATIQLISAQEPERLAGRALKTVVFDEYADMDPDVWENVRPRLGDIKLQVWYGELGRTLFISTPAGYNHLKELFDQVREGKKGPGWHAWRYTSIEGQNIPPTELEDAKREMDARLFRQEYEASFESVSGRIYHAFMRENYSRGGLANCGNLDESVKDKGGPILVGMDFNVNPMCATLSSKVASERTFLGNGSGRVGVHYELHTWKEYRIENCNTQMMMQVLKEKHPGRQLLVFPDPSGTARHTTSSNVGESDHKIIRQMGGDIYVPKFRTNSDKYNCVNGLLQNAMGHRRALINPRECPWLVRSLDGLVYVKGSNLPDKSSGLDHQSDAYSYSVLGAFPIIHDEVRISKVAI